MKMAKKSYKKRYEELLARTQADDKISKHTRRYIHIPFSWEKIGRFFAFLGSIGLAIAHFFLLVSVGYTYKVWELLSSNEPQETYFSQFIIFYPLIGQYLLIGLVLVCLVALIKGGFKKIKGYKEDGLIFWLLIGLIVWPILGMFAGPIAWATAEFIGRLLFWMPTGVNSVVTSGLIVGMFAGLTGGLLFGMLTGLIKEFDYEEIKK